MRLQFSRPLVMVAGQAVVNTLLAAWLYVEYAHNPFGQQYLSGFLASNIPTISSAVVLAGAIAGGSYLALSRRVLTSETAMASTVSTATGQAMSAKLQVMDECPICDVPLKALSDNRFQCRKCHRYYKK